MKKVLVPFLVLSIMIAAACNKSSNNATHHVTVRLTDNPFDAQEVNVEIIGVQLRYDDDSKDSLENSNDGIDDNSVREGDDSNCVTIKTEAKIYNLLDLQNNVNVILAQGPFTHDHLKEIRLKLGTNNTIKIADKVYPLKVPSGNSSGYKIKIDEELAAGSTDFLVDFDVAASVHQTSDGQYILKPVLRRKR